VYGRVKLTLDRAFGQAKGIGDFTQFQTLMMAHREYQPLPRRQPRDLRVEHLRNLSAIGLFFGSRPFFGRVRHAKLRVFRERRPSGWRVPALVIDASVHHDPIQPRGQLRVVPEAIKRTEHLDEHVLGDIFGVVVVPGELVGETIDHRPVPLNERMERRAVAGRRAGCEF